MRPAYYGPKEKSAEAIVAEVTAVRENVGIIDVSTLGGLDIRGPDAAAFVDRIYTFNFLKQPVGRTRYALLTDETGVIIDDGVACRLHDQHFYVTATTGAVDQVYRLMGFWNQQWRLDVDIANVTAAYAGINIAGPNARAVIDKLESDIDFSAAAFPYLAVRTGHLAGIPVRVLRVGFVGEAGSKFTAPRGSAENCGTSSLRPANRSASSRSASRPSGSFGSRRDTLSSARIPTASRTPRKPE